MSAVMPMPRIARRAIPVRRIAGWLLFAVVLAAWVAYLRPTGLGGHASYVTVSGESMEPTMYNGDFVITREQSDYEVGDVLVYRIEEGEVGAGGMVIHRIIGGSIEDGFVTQGDNRDKPDHWYPTEAEIVGKVWVEMPNVGEWLPYLRSPIVIAGFAAVMAFFYVMSFNEKDAEEGTA